MELKKGFKRAFTLAEIMIVLSIIGALTAILMPIALHSAPDEKVMKFKKADTTLKNVIRELVNSDYYADGDLGKLKNGDLVGKSKRSVFCHHFADIVSTKKVVCNYETGLTNTTISASGQSATTGQNEDLIDTEIANKLDSVCLTAEQNFSGENIGVLTTDNIYYFEASLHNPFGCKYSSSGNDCTTINPGWGASAEGHRLYNDFLDLHEYSSGITAPRFYRIFCIDIDKIKSGEAPFGYGIRVDGKIVLGTRAKDWLEKGFQKGKNEN